MAKQHDTSEDDEPRAAAGQPAALDAPAAEEAEPRLTSGQRRAIGALLHRVARTIERFEVLTGLHLEERLAYVDVVDHLEADEHAEARALATALVREANALAELCRIPPEVSSVRATLAGEFSVLWADAEDTNPRRLEGYGPVAPETVRRVTPHTDRIARLSMALSRMQSPSGGGTAPSSPSTPRPPQDA
jgi:hypothetical protein